MKSKSFDLKQASLAERDKPNKTFDFVGLYKSSAETKQLPEKRKLSDVPSNENVKNKLGTPKLERSSNKSKRKQRNESVELSQINVDGSSLNSSLGGRTPLNDSKTTSTPYAARKPQVSRVKSIMKTTLVNEDDQMDGSKETIISKPKKRNKSVSFMLDDNEEVVIKKTKSDDSLIKNKDSGNTKQKISKDKVKIIKKMKKDRQSEKENKGSDVNIEQQIKQKLPKINKVNTPSDSQTNTDPDAQMQLETQNRKKKSKKSKKLKVDSNLQTESENTKNEQLVEKKIKKNKKKKQIKPFTEEGEPVTKAHKKDVKPDLIAEDLENLSIGDNAHTLSNLLDEMSVVDKEKRKKNKLKQNKEHKKLVASNNETPLENDDKKEKVKWKRRKWNKDRKGEMNAEGLVTSVIVENLPISIMLTYKKLLADHFGKHGLINKIGIAEVYPTQESKPVFTTTINFYSDGAAEQALEEDGTVFEGSRIRVKRPLPASDTTLVLRSYAALGEPAVSSLLVGAGRIRNIRQLVKGKKAMSTAFVEFDGPESVERAIKKCANLKIDGKKVHIAKFEVRNKEKKLKDDINGNRGDSDDSNE